LRSLSSSSMPFLEVEEKFSLTNRDPSELADRLQGLGFSLAGEGEFADFYYDIVAENAFELLRQDCWLRFRDVKGGESVWQLKRGQPCQTSAGTNNVATVYEEIEGIDAVKVACSLLSGSSTIDSNSSSTPFPCSEDVNTPVLPIAGTGLAPFAMIATRRSSWKVADSQKQDKYRGLTVDLDATNFDYAVGEVEVLVADTNQVIDARRRIRALIEDIGGLSNTKAEGKLEYFLQKHRPEVYQICIDSGVL